MQRPWNLLLGFLSFCSLAFSNASFSISPVRISRQETPSSPVTLRALADPSEEPYFCAVNDEPMGIISDIAALLGKKSNQTIELLRVTSYEEYETHLRDQDYDLLLNASDSFPSNFLEGYELTTSYLNVSYSKAVLRNNTKAPTTIACLGDNSMAGIYARSFYYANQIQTYPTIDEALGAVKREECYAAIVNSIYAQKLQNEDIRSVYSFTKHSDHSLKLKMAVKQGDNGALLQALNDAIKNTNEDEINAIVSRYSHFVKPTPTLVDQMYLNPLPYSLGAGCLFLVFVAIMLILFYSSRRKSMVLANREFERFITYVCQNNEAVFEVNLQTRLMSHYLLEDKKVKNVQRPFSLEKDFLDKIYPDDRPSIEQEINEGALHTLIAQGGVKSLETRVEEKEGHYLWSYIIVQGIIPSRAQ